jgi:hypothetical protein
MRQIIMMRGRILQRTIFASVRRQFSQKLDASAVTLGKNCVEINWPPIQTPEGTTVKCYRVEHFPSTDEYYSTISVIRNWVKIENIEVGKKFHFQITPVFGNEVIADEPCYVGDFSIPDEVIDKTGI